MRYYSEWHTGYSPLYCPFPKQAKIHFENGLQETHVGSLIESNLVFPKINNKKFG
jgi:hypothetical protein